MMIMLDLPADQVGGHDQLSTLRRRKLRFAGWWTAPTRWSVMSGSKLRT
jgi:hypothetical protein